MSQFISIKKEKRIRKDKDTIKSLSTKKWFHRLFPQSSPKKEALRLKAQQKFIHMNYQRRTSVSDEKLEL